MIKPNDHILLGVSGGKDSLSLLHLLIHLQKNPTIPFTLGVITVDPMIAGFDPSPLQGYYESLGIEFHYQQQAIMKQAKQHMKKPSFCAYCSRMKRGIMYQTARDHHYNVLALAQHLDDIAESFFMSMFHGGNLHTMKAHYLNDAKDIRVIRPLAYARERQTADFAQSRQLPVIPDNCPACFDKPTQRHYMKQLLATEEQQHQHLFQNLRKAMQPLMSDASLSALS